MVPIQYYPAGDTALVVEFGQKIEEQTNDRVHAMARWLQAQRMRGVTEVIPTFRSVMICYDPCKISYSRLVRKIRRWNGVQTVDAVTQKVIHRIPVCYDGPDLEDMERLTGLRREEIVSIHSGTDYKIHMMGFLPGFVYLGGLDPRIGVPRLDTPRTKIEAGSVGIGGSQTGVYPVASPGGWRILGFTPVRFYDPDRPDPILCKAGEYIRFVPISRAEFDREVGK